MLELVLFGLFPYVAVVVAVTVSVQRFLTNRFTYSSLSSQFLENRTHFWGSLPFHIGILMILLGHIVGFLIPQQMLIFNGSPLRLIFIEVVSLVFGLMALFGLVNLIWRRLQNAKVNATTSFMDMVLLILLLLQVLAGVSVAIFFRWGSAWYLVNAVPYLRSLFVLQPDVAHIAVLPWAIKLHVLGAFAMVAVFPFTRLVHMFSVPNSYLWRRPQVVVWNKKRGQ